MKATIPGENEEGIGVDVIDNNGAEHEITFEKQSNEIVYHQCEQYADDPANRTPEENEYNRQARRYARYYVFLNRGYDTVDPKWKNPVHLQAVRSAIDSMDLEEFESHFGDLYQQLKSHHDDDTERVLHPPSDSQDEDYHLYRKHVYLGLDPLETDLADDARELATEFGLDLDQHAPTETSLSGLTDDGLKAWTSFSTELFERSDGDELAELAEGFYVDTTSELHMAYLDHDGIEQVTTAIEPDREPDARLEVSPIEPRSMEHFKAALEFNLICQIRDCFIRMGVTPPEEFQVLGVGLIAAVQAYDEVDFYPDYHLIQDDGTFYGDINSKYFSDNSLLGSVKSLLN
ncbi:hypothetical protein D8Y22_10705 [Salinadaptatus halalkaliphilus]|uniref:Uncharacterized protein n=1 Tax=Salinadaptatus halalkaliphilus TaxID=2419781 RepID=A0A4S3TL07_9EURY|nr:hypothetical protein [Salinadaptatus halalkaliphilus]THE64834.1 hypothetical protein D8Y22_10705 [Salinadaptatus halalkaliphilus]